MYRSITCLFFELVAAAKLYYIFRQQLTGFSLFLSVLLTVTVIGVTVI
jgi:hypothetical protein